MADPTDDIIFSEKEIVSPEAAAYALKDAMGDVSLDAELYTDYGNRLSASVANDNPAERTRAAARAAFLNNEAIPYESTLDPLVTGSAPASSPEPADGSAPSPEPATSPTPASGDKPESSGQAAGGAPNADLDPEIAEIMKKQKEAEDKILKRIENAKTLAEEYGDSPFGKLANIEVARLTEILQKSRAKFYTTLNRHQSNVAQWESKQRPAQNADGQKSGLGINSGDMSKRPGAEPILGSLFRRRAPAPTADAKPPLPTDLNKAPEDAIRDAAGSAFAKFQDRRAAVEGQSNITARLSGEVIDKLDKLDGAQKVLRDIESSASSCGVPLEEFKAQVYGTASVNEANRDVVDRCRQELKDAIRNDPDLSAVCDNLDRAMDALPDQVNSLGEALKKVVDQSGVKIDDVSEVKKILKDAIGPAADRLPNPANPDKAARLAEELEKALREIINMIMKKLAKAFGFEYEPIKPRQAFTQAPIRTAPGSEEQPAPSVKVGGAARRVEPAFDAPRAPEPSDPQLAPGG